MNDDKYVAELLANDEIKRFCKQHKISTQEIIKNMNNIYMFKEADEACKNCNHKECLNDTPYMKMEMTYKNGKVAIEYTPCAEASKINGGEIEYLCCSEPTDEEVFFNDNRKQLMIELRNFKDSYAKGVYTKGLYVYGPYGCGKTFVLYDFAQLLAKDGCKVIFTYYPDLVRMLKSSINENKLEKYIIKLKNIEVLFLDDFGGEANTPFIRDEVIGPILQYRMDNHLPVFFTSNYDIEGLKGHLSETSLETNQIKANRITERVKSLAKIVKLKDNNYRA